MTKTYEDYEQDYQSHLSRIRSFLASTRSQSTLLECQRLLASARKCATAMQGLAEVEGDRFRIQEASQLNKRDLIPLEDEVKRGLRGGSDRDLEQGREQLFYQGPGNQQQQQTLTTQSLIQSSDDLLRETQALCSDTEQIGMSTLTQMGVQREQLQIASDNLDATHTMALQAGQILRKMRQKIFRNKCSLYIIIMALLAANIFVIYLIFKKHTK